MNSQDWKQKVVNAQDFVFRNCVCTKVGDLQMVFFVQTQLSKSQNCECTKSWFPKVWLHNLANWGTVTNQVKIWVFIALNLFGCTLDVTKQVLFETFQSCFVPWTKPCEPRPSMCQRCLLPDSGWWMGVCCSLRDKLDLWVLVAWFDFLLLPFPQTDAF